MIIRKQIEAVIMRIKTDLDMLDMAAKDINRGPGGREVSLAITKLQEARHWLIDGLTEIDMVMPCSGCGKPKKDCICDFDMPVG